MEHVIDITEIIVNMFNGLLTLDLFNGLITGIIILAVVLMLVGFFLKKGGL